MKKKKTVQFIIITQNKVTKGACVRASIMIKKVLHQVKTWRTSCSVLSGNATSKSHVFLLALFS